MTFRNFITDLNQQIGIRLPPNWESITDEIALAQRVLERLNEYFFQTDDGIGTTILNGKEYQYFSEFHKFWEAHHVEILNAKIDRAQARIAARALHNAFLKYQYLRQKQVKKVGLFGYSCCLPQHQLTQESPCQRF